jgi:hypothetical protein
MGRSSRTTFRRCGSRWRRSSKHRTRERSRGTDPRFGGNEGGNEVGANRIPAWLSVSACPLRESGAVQGIPDENRGCRAARATATEPKVRGSNPLGRAPEPALVSQILAGLRQLGTTGWERVGTRLARLQPGSRDAHDPGRRSCGPRFSEPVALSSRRQHDERLVASEPLDQGAVDAGRGRFRDPAHRALLAGGRSHTQAKRALDVARLARPGRLGPTVPYEQVRLLDVLSQEMRAMS